MFKRKPPPSKKAIIDYWIENCEPLDPEEKHGHRGRGEECGMGADMSEWHERCWCCGRLEDLERCHIIPHALGGSNHPSNFVLLCNYCHQQAPNVDDEHEMWRFIYKNRSTFYYTKEEDAYIDERTRYWVSKSSVHFGHGGELNESTRLWVARKVHDDYMKKYLPQFYGM